MARSNVVRAKDPSFVQGLKVRANGMVRIDGVWKPLTSMGEEILDEVFSYIEQRQEFGGTMKDLPIGAQAYWRSYGLLDPIPKAALDHYMTDHGVVEPYGALPIVIGTIMTEDLIVHLDGIASKQGYTGWDEYHEWVVENVLKDKDRGVPVGSTETWPIILSTFTDEGIQDGVHRFHQYVQAGKKSVPFLAFADELFEISLVVDQWRENYCEVAS